jgi:hypothetical protein
MNFDNPVYRKTTEEQVNLDKGVYQPSRPLPAVSKTPFFSGTFIIGVARICRGGGCLVKNGRFSRSIFKKNSGERNFTINFKDFFPKGVVCSPRPPLPTPMFTTINDYICISIA